MTGHRKFAWKVENLPPSEWFDLDREEKMTPHEDGEWDPDDTVYPEDDWLPDEDDIRNVCPTCGSDSLDWLGEHFWDNEYVGDIWKCANCASRFVEYDFP